MKKLIAAIFVALLTTAGLVATSTGAAQAACPYTSCVVTKTNLTVPATVKAGRKASISVKVTAQGNLQPVGKVVVTIKGKGFKQTLSKAVSGERTFSFVTRSLKKPGKYTVSAAYAPKPGSVFKASSAIKSFRVVRRSN